MNLHRRDDRPLVIGHRGAAAVAPENTLASLEAAVAAGVDLVEFDIGPDLTLAHSSRELPEAAVSLDQALEYLREHNVGAHLDVKQVGPEDGVVDAIRRHGLMERTVVSTAYAETSRRIAVIAPQLTRAIGYPRDTYGVSRFPWPQGLTATGAAALRAAMPLRIPLLLRRAHADALALHHTLVSRAAVARSHARGAPVLAWTVNEPAAVERVVRLGVDAIVTDNPSMCLATLNSL